MRTILISFLYNCILQINEKISNFHKIINSDTYETYEKFKMYPTNI